MPRTFTAIFPKRWIMDATPCSFRIYLLFSHQAAVDEDVRSHGEGGKLEQWVAEDI
jgi:hypothetical protein